MRKLAWLALILFIFFVVFITLGATNYAGIGDAVGGFMQNTIVAPVRDMIVDTWLWVGSSGWYILLVSIGISVFGAVFWIPIFWNLVIQKGLKEKVLHRQPPAATPYQSSPSATPIAITPTTLQSTPSQKTVPATPTVKQEPTPKPQETQTE